MTGHSLAVAAVLLARQDRDTAVMLLVHSLSPREGRRRIVHRLMVDSVMRQAALLGVFDER